MYKRNLSDRAFFIACIKKKRAAQPRPGYTSVIDSIGVFLTPAVGRSSFTKLAVLKRDVQNLEDGKVEVSLQVDEGSFRVGMDRPEGKDALNQFAQLIAESFVKTLSPEDVALFHVILVPIGGGSSQQCK